MLGCFRLLGEVDTRISGFGGDPFFPGLALQHRRHFDLLLTEVKGTDLRRRLLEGKRGRRFALAVFDTLVGLMEDHRARIFGRIWIKEIGVPINHTAIYTSSIQAICACFQDFLASTDETGIAIADSRTHGQNTRVSHSIFTQKFKTAGDAYSRILEMPTFGHSENHVGLQIADLLCSGLLFPMAAYAYCHGHLRSIHVRSEYKILRDRYGARLMKLQHRYCDAMGTRMVGGLTVSDGIGKKSGAYLFGDREPKPITAVAISHTAALGAPATSVTSTPPLQQNPNGTTSTSSL